MTLAAAHWERRREVTETRDPALTERSCFSATSASTANSTLSDCPPLSSPPADPRVSSSAARRACSVSAPASRAVVGPVGRPIAAAETCISPGRGSQPQTSRAERSMALVCSQILKESSHCQCHCHLTSLSDSRFYTQAAESLHWPPLHMTLTVFVRGAVVGIHRRGAAVRGDPIGDVPGAGHPLAHGPPRAPAGDRARLAAAAALPAVLGVGARRLRLLRGGPAALAQHRGGSAAAAAAQRLAAGAELHVRRVVLAAGSGCQRRALCNLYGNSGESHRLADITAAFRTSVRTAVPCTPQLHHHPQTARTNARSAYSGAPVKTRLHLCVVDELQRAVEPVVLVVDAARVAHDNARQRILPPQRRVRRPAVGAGFGRRLGQRRRLLLRSVHSPGRARAVRRAADCRSLLLLCRRRQHCRLRYRLRRCPKALLPTALAILREPHRHISVFKPIRSAPCPPLQLR